MGKKYANGSRRGEISSKLKQSDSTGYAKLDAGIATKFVLDQGLLKAPSLP